MNQDFISLFVGALLGNVTGFLLWNIGLKIEPKIANKIFDWIQRRKHDKEWLRHVKTLGDKGNKER